MLYIYTGSLIENDTFLKSKKYFFVIFLICEPEGWLYMSVNLHIWYGYDYISSKFEKQIFFEKSHFFITIQLLPHLTPDLPGGAF